MLALLDNAVLGALMLIGPEDGAADVAGPSGLVQGSRRNLW